MRSVERLAGSDIIALGEYTPADAAGSSALSPCYTGFVYRNVTIRLTEETAKWARRKAAEEDTSVSRLVGAMLEREMRQSNEYWKGYELWKSSLQPAPLNAQDRASREETHDRELDRRLTREMYERQARERERERGADQRG